MRRKNRCDSFTHAKLGNFDVNFGGARNLLRSDQEDALADEYYCTVSAMVQVLLRALCASLSRREPVSRFSILARRASRKLQLPTHSSFLSFSLSFLPRSSRQLTFTHVLTRQTLAPSNEEGQVHGRGRFRVGRNFLGVVRHSR